MTRRSIAVKLRQDTYERLDSYRNADQTFDGAITELLDAAERLKAGRKRVRKHG